MLLGKNASYLTVQILTHEEASFTCEEAIESSKLHILDTFSVTKNLATIFPMIVSEICTERLQKLKNVQHLIFRHVWRKEMTWKQCLLQRYNSE